jgi:hypothetical protein
MGLDRNREDTGRKIHYNNFDTVFKTKRERLDGYIQTTVMLLIQNDSKNELKSWNCIVY